MAFPFSLLELAGLIGTAVSAFLFLRFLWQFVYTQWIGKSLGHTLDVTKLGRWAVITGATDGIGRAYAEELASRGLNVVLISRSPYKLETVAQEIESQYKVQTKVISVDFTRFDIYDRIAEELRGLEIGVLVNNVGMSYSYPEYLCQVPEAVSFATSLINCNVTSVTRMTLLVLPQMTERRKGLILNIASASAVLPTPLMTMYSSTKAFVLKFSQDLNLECRSLGITVQCVLPGFVATNMSRIRKPRLDAPIPRDFVRGQMQTLGLEVDSPGYWVHKLQVAWYTSIYYLRTEYLRTILLEGLQKMRLGGLRRLEKQRREYMDTQVDKKSDYEWKHVAGEDTNRNPVSKTM